MARRGSHRTTPAPAFEAAGFLESPPPTAAADASKVEQLRAMKAQRDAKAKSSTKPKATTKGKRGSAADASKVEQLRAMKAQREAKAKSNVWIEKSDPNSGRTYFVNTETRERTWKKPDLM